MTFYLSKIFKRSSLCFSPLEVNMKSPRSDLNKKVFEKELFQGKKQEVSKDQRMVCLHINECYQINAVFMTYVQVIDKNEDYW